MNAGTIRIGRFSYDRAKNQIEGPADYLQDQGDAKLTRMLHGKDAGFDGMIACAPSGTDPMEVMLVTLQADFAGWFGNKQKRADRRRAATRRRS